MHSATPQSKYCNSYKSRFAPVHSLEPIVAVENKPGSGPVRPNSVIHQAAGPLQRSFPWLPSLYDVALPAWHFRALPCNPDSMYVRPFGCDTNRIRHRNEWTFFPWRSPSVILSSVFQPWMQTVSGSIQLSMQLPVGRTGKRKKHVHERVESQRNRPRR